MKKYFLLLFLIIIIFSCQNEKVDENLLTAYFIYPATNQQKIGLINQYGKIIVAPEYDDIIVSENIAVVKKNEKYGYIDNKGNFLRPIDLDYAAPFCSGYAVSSKNGRTILINAAGKIVSEFDTMYKPYMINGFFNGLSVFENCKYDIDSFDKCHFGYIDIKGNCVIDPIYSSADNFKFGIAKVCDSDSCFLIDTKGRKVNFPVSDYELLIDKFHHQIHNSPKRIDLNGESVSMYPYENKLALVWINNYEYGWVDMDTNFVIKLRK